MIWLQLAGSLAGVLGLALIAKLLGLGREPRIADAAHAIRLAEEAHIGFEAFEAAVDRGGYCAILRNAQGRHLLIRAHGNHFVTRFVEAPVDARLDRRMLTVSGDRLFGSVTLDLGDEAAHWASGLRRIKGLAHG